MKYVGQNQTTNRESQYATRVVKKLRGLSLSKPMFYFKYHK